ncbi:MAG: L-seryl-tRNA(Sec) selenium transferase, partial [Oscillospiraceae bacterium]|nr:L-seryl-tRNA(Sec) selenium transferase [Oscillospiraceae bacterium]
MSVNTALLRKIPKIDEILKQTSIEAASQTCSHNLLVESARETLDNLRQSILGGNETVSLEMEDICKEILALAAKKNQMHLRPVINATGIILHTNLGRARLSDRAVEAIKSIAQDYNTLEYNLEKGSRGSRYDHVEDLIAKITGAEEAIAVNNNAAAVMLILSTMAKGHEVIVSRGELVEIGGAFRVPD